MKKAIEIEKRGTLNTQTGYVFETSTKYAPKSAHRTVASVLLERYQNNIDAFASSRVVGKIVNGRSKFYCSQSKVGYDVLADAINAEIAYLNSAAEVGK